MEFLKANWRVLKKISNGAFVVMAVIWVLDWYNREQVELVINDPTAKAYWLQINHLYERIGWISLAIMVGLRVSYWTIEYIHDRRLMGSNKGDGWQNKQET